MCVRAMTAMRVRKEEMDLVEWGSAGGQVGVGPGVVCTVNEKSTAGEGKRIGTTMGTGTVIAAKAKLVTRAVGSGMVEGVALVVQGQLDGTRATAARLLLRVFGGASLTMKIAMIVATAMTTKGKGEGKYHEGRPRHEHHHYRRPYRPEAKRTRGRRLETTPSGGKGRKTGDDGVAAAVVVVDMVGVVMEVRVQAGTETVSMTKGRGGQRGRTAPRLG